MDVAVIDDGVNENRYSIGHLAYSVEIGENLSVRERTDYDRYAESHGTICAGIIKKYAPEAEISSIKILQDQTKKCRPEQLIRALEWCDQKKIRLLNLSVGSIEYADYIQFRPVVAELLRKGHVLVAAVSNKKDHAWPACFSGVLGVKNDCSFVNGEYRAVDANYDGVGFFAAGSHDLVKYDGSPFRTPHCNSFSAPLITALACNVLSEHPELPINRVKWALCQNSGSDVYNRSFSNARPDFIDQSIVLNLSGKKFKGNFFFSKTKEYTDSDYTNLTFDEKTYVTVIPGRRMKFETVLSILLQNQPNIAGVLYAGAAPEALKKFCFDSGCFLWEENSYKALLNCMPDIPCDSDVPIICIQKVASSDLVNALELSRLLTREGYNCRVLSDLERSYLYGIDYVPSLINSRPTVRNIVKEFGLSVVVYCTTKNANQYADCYLQFADREAGSIAEHRTIRFPVYSNTINAKEIVNLIEHAL